MSDDALLQELEPTVEALLERHLDTHEGVVPPRATFRTAEDGTRTASGPQPTPISAAHASTTGSAAR